MKTYETLIADIRKDARELNEKLTALENFMMTEDFVKISPRQQVLLVTQHRNMSEYKRTLIKRANLINLEHKQNTPEGGNQ